jgi:hypothetical protein
MKSVIDNRGRMQAQMSTPVVEDPSLPIMDSPTDTAAAAAGTELGGSFHDQATRSAVSDPSARASNLMEPFTPEEEPAEDGVAVFMPPVFGEEGRAYPDQQEVSTPAAREPTGAEEGYIRLTFKVEDGRLSITAARSVPGPLIAEQDIRQGEMVYEVTRLRRLLAAGTLPPDAHLARGMPHPEGTGKLAGHHISELESFEFTARIPKRELSVNTLRELGATVYRVKGGGPLDVPVSAIPMRETEASEQLRVVAETHGFDLNDLSPELQEELRAALQ